MTDDGEGARDRVDAGRVREVAAVFLRLGVVAFGGPAGHIAMMHTEVVDRRGWVDRQRFLDLVGATNLIPGPNSTELAIHLGYDRARWRGLVAAGVCFVLPAALLVTAMAWAYLRYGETPAVSGMLHGVVPVVLAVIGRALLGLLRTAMPTAWLAALSVAALSVYLLGVHELVVLAAGALVAGAAHLVRTYRPGVGGLTGLPLLAADQPHFTDPTGGELAQLVASMLRTGALLFGSGYVLLAFLRGDFVDRLGWITEEQLLDAISVGQATPGPVFTTATFVGYLVAGPLGALLATVAIFLPSFCLVALLTRLTGWMRSSDWTSAVLDGINATALALMAGVSYHLARAALVDPLAIALAVVAAVALWRTRISPAWLVLAAALVGLGAELVA